MDEQKTKQPDSIEEAMLVAVERIGDQLAMLNQQLDRVVIQLNGIAGWLGQISGSLPFAGRGM